MKNVHLLPTDKPSRLFKDNSQALNLHTHPVMKGMFTNGIGSNQHLYITSSEEIKLSNWACHKGITNDKYQLVKCTISNKESIQEHWSKIILTTDPDLIKDGVQAIDDEFLEWFFKNPSCEEVEVESFCKYGDDCPSKGAYLKQHLCDIGYKIITPKEEPKLVNNCPKCGLDLVVREACTPVCTDIDCRGIILSNETLREWALQKEEQKQHLIDIMKGDEELGLYDEPKRETIEDAALRNKMLDKEFVPYDESLELKAIGFNEHCFGFYTDRKQLKRYTNFDGDLNEFQTLKNSRITFGDGWCAAPTFSQAFEFFRKYSKWPIESWIQPYLSEQPRQYEGFYWRRGQTVSIGVFPTHEETELSCLRKLIEICRKIK